MTLEEDNHRYGEWGYIILIEGPRDGQENRGLGCKIGGGSFLAEEYGIVLRMGLEKFRVFRPATRQPLDR